MAKEVKAQEAVKPVAEPQDSNSALESLATSMSALAQSQAKNFSFNDTALDGVDSSRTELVRDEETGEVAIRWTKGAQAGKITTVQYQSIEEAQKEKNQRNYEAI